MTRFWNTGTPTEENGDYLIEFADGGHKIATVFRDKDDKFWFKCAEKVHELTVNEYCENVKWFKIPWGNYDFK